jgi:hypothetical protein
MSNCQLDEKDIRPDKVGAQFGMSIITIIYIFFSLFVIGIILSIKKKNTVTPEIPKTTNFVDKFKNWFNGGSGGSNNQIDKYTDDFSGRFTEWFTKVGNSINSATILAILAAGVVIGFNGLIMTPLISSMFPKDITHPMEIPGKHIYINPGLFFIALIGFVVSLIIFFFVAEGINIVKKHFKRPLIIVSIFLLFVFLTFMLIWNALQTDKLLKSPDCVKIGTSTKIFNKLNKPQLDSQTYPDSPDPLQPQLPMFGMFG